MKNTHSKQNEKEYNGAAFGCMLLMLLLIMPSVQAELSISIMNESDPLEYGLPQQLIINISSNSSIIQASIIIDQQEYALQQQGLFYSYSWVPEELGLEAYSVKASDDTNQTVTLDSNFTVRDTEPPAIIAIQPAGLINYGLVELTAETDEYSVCRYDDVDTGYDAMIYQLSGEQTAHTQLRSFNDGSYVFYVKCKDASGNQGDTSVISFTIDTSPPQISSITPTGTVVEADQNLAFMTDAPAICKWDKTHQEFSSMANSFRTTGSTWHEQPLVLNDGINSYFISCKDNAGNTHQTIIINIELNIEPKAEISVKKNDGYGVLRKGTYEVNLQSSEPLKQAPGLKFNCNGNTIEIPLEGNQQEWNSYLIVPEGLGVCAGEFKFQGIDKKGTPGTEITGGKIVLVDTTIPAAPHTLKLSNQNSSIKLAWVYEGEDIDHFNIYRSTSGNTAKTDLLTSTQNQGYTDHDVSNKIGYFYRISAVDKAGNEGELSEEEFIMADFQNLTLFVQDPQVLALLNAKQAELERKDQSIEIMISWMENNEDTLIKELVESLDLVNSQSEIRNNIQSIIGELKSYRQARVTVQDIEAKLALIDTKLRSHDAAIITNVEVMMHSELEQQFEEEYVNQAVDEYLKNALITDLQKKEYKDRISTLHESMRVKREITGYKISFTGKAQENPSLVKKSLIASSSLQGLLLQELLVDDSLKVSDLDFQVPPDDMNVLGPIWSLDKLPGSQLKYESSKSGIDALSQTSSVVLLDLEKFLASLAEKNQSSQEQLTGNVVKTVDAVRLDQLLIPLALFVLVGLLTYYLVFLKNPSNQVPAAANKIQNLSVSKPAGDEQAAVSYDPKTFAASAMQLRPVTDYDRIIGNLETIYMHIERGDLVSATNQYAEALDLYRKTKFGIKDRVKLNFEINSAYDVLKERSFIK